MNYLSLNVNELFLLIMTKEMREAGACYEAGTGFMCTRGELAEQANNMEPQIQGADSNTQPQTNPIYPSRRRANPRR